MATQYRTIEFADRKKIEAMYAAGARPADIAAEIGVSRTAVYCELKRGQGGKLDKNQRLAYDATLAQRNVQEALRRRGRRPDGEEGKGGSDNAKN